MSTVNSDGGFIVQLLTGRFFTAFSTIMILSFIGTSYIFGLYSSDIKSTLGYDQTTLNLISFFKDFGAYVSVQAGLIMEVSPPWVVLVLGSALNFVGYFMVWLSITHRVARPQVWQMCLYIAIGANSLGFANTGAFVTCVKNFPENRGSVIGILKGYIGLGGAIMTQLYHAIYGNDTNAVGVILLISWLPTLPMLLFAYNIRLLKAVQRQVNKEKKFFRNILYMSLALAGFITVMIIVQRKVNFTKSGYSGSFAVIMVLLILPIFLVIREECAAWKSKSITETSNDFRELKIVQRDSPTPTSKHVPYLQDVFRPPPSGEDHTILQAILSVDMNILMIATVCCTGGLLTTIDNIGQIGASLGYSKRSISTLVSLIAIWQYLGRVMGGVISEYFLTKFRWPRPFVYAITLFLTCIGHLLIAFNAPYGLYIATVISGFSFGATATYFFAIISELFGLKYYATLYNYIQLSCILGSFVFNVRVTGHLYDREGTRQLHALGLSRAHGQQLKCNGVKCYQLSYIIISAATFFGGLLCLILAARTRKFYKSDVYDRFRDAKELSPKANEVEGEDSSEFPRKKDEERT